MFNSRDSRHRSPKGAVAEETPVHFKIDLPRELGCSAAYLIMEQERGEVQCLDMFWCGMNGENEEWWECDFAPSHRGLYFYHFEMKTCRGRMRLSRGQRGQATLGGFDRWQMTVYAKGMDTPHWLSGGIMYQIFPDRFARSNVEKQRVPTDRKIHENWYSQPDWAPNREGHITNTDFFGGDLRGIEEKLPYLKELGVTCIYCNPLFEAHSNHRYDTADYSRIDPLLGTEEDFISLCSAAKKLGIRLILDGVFSHTGSDSVYFNREGRYSTEGAYQSQSSPYFPWYSFRKWPEEYDCWWNFITLPNVNETNPAYDAYINGSGGIVQKWLSLGASGWRLDVADELPDAFIDSLSAAAKAQSPEALVLGEVWEDASHKTAYGVRRRYLLGGQLDTVMNYPFRESILSFLLTGGAEIFADRIESVLENYPPQSIRLLMNHIGTHDTERVLTVLGGEPVGQHDRNWQSCTEMTATQRDIALKRLKLASLLQFTLPGVPCIYYGDEAGLSGYKDPFNRACYPWGKEDKTLISWYKGLGALRQGHQPFFVQGEYETLGASGNLMAFSRGLPGCPHARLVVVVNRSSRPQSMMSLDLTLGRGQVLLGEDLSNVRILPPYGYSVMKFTQFGKKT